MTLHAIDGTSVFDIGERGRMVKRMTIVFENRFQFPECIHQLVIRRVNFPQAVTFLRNVKLLVQGVPIRLP